MCFSHSKTTGAWGELLSLRASILLQLSEAHLLRKSYSSSLERADEGLKLVSLNGCGSKSHWKTFASLAHQKVKVLVTMSCKARDCSSNLKGGSLCYCGHGSGREYLMSEVFEQMHCHACSILMGCGSGRLKFFGPKIEPFGVVLQYWIGGRYGALQQVECAVNGEAVFTCSVQM
ncbi:hypothetical protein V5799_004275 [Amblyomma americanum]|uniref:Peptidase C50 domain-containing protein n=1 Tax=Amblyomma americanum TaxID=6943 RepID=A0AAQ4D6L0_AMBAM